MRSYASAIVLAAGILGVCGVTAPASAAIVDVTYIGTVTFDIDQTGQFGTVGGLNDLLGLPYVGHFVFDTTKGSTGRVSYESYAFGGALDGDESPVVSASVTVNGYTQNVSGQDYGSIFGGHLGSVSEQYHYAENLQDLASVYAYRYAVGQVYVPGSSIPAQIDVPFTYIPSGPNNNYAQYYDIEYDKLTGVTTKYTAVYADITGVTVTSTVPEASTWVMMLMGFAGLGVLGRRASKTVAPVLGLESR